MLRRPRDESDDGGTPVRSTPHKHQRAGKPADGGPGRHGLLPIHPRLESRRRSSELRTMSSTSPVGTGNLRFNPVDRARDLILHPAQEWKVINAEPQTVQGLYTPYVMILSAIPAICGFIGFSLVGVG